MNMISFYQSHSFGLARASWEALWTHPVGTAQRTHPGAIHPTNHKNPFIWGHLQRVSQYRANFHLIQHIKKSIKPLLAAEEPMVSRCWHVYPLNQGTPTKPENQSHSRLMMRLWYHHRFKASIWMSFTQTSDQIPCFWQYRRNSLRVQT